MSNTLIREARCHCCQLRVVASGEPEHVYTCNSKACQRRTGSLLHFGAFWAKSEVSIAGIFNTFQRDTQAGTKIRFHFCPECGSNVFRDSDRRTASFGIAAGCFADSEFPAPTFSVRTKYRPDWLEISSVTVEYCEALGE